MAKKTTTAAPPEPEPPEEPQPSSPAEPESRGQRDGDSAPPEPQGEKAEATGATPPEGSAASAGTLRSAQQAAQFAHHMNRYYADLVRPLDRMVKNQRNLEAFIQSIQNSPTQRLVRDLQEAYKNNTVAVERLNQFGQIAEAAKRFNQLPDNSATKLLYDTWAKQDAALEGAREATKNSFAQAQALIARADDLPASDEKAELVAEATESQQLTARIDDLIALFQVGTDMQRDAGVRETRLGELTEQLVASSSDLVKATKDSGKLALANTFLAVVLAGIGIATFLRDFGWIGPQSTPQVIVVQITPEPTVAPTEAPTRAPTPEPTPTPQSTPTPVPATPAQATPAGSR